MSLKDCLSRPRSILGQNIILDSEWLVLANQLDAL